MRFFVILGVLLLAHSARGQNWWDSATNWVGNAARNTYNAAASATNYVGGQIANGYNAVVNHPVTQQAAQWTHRNVVAPVANTYRAVANHPYTQAAVSAVREAPAALARTGFRTLNTAFAGGAAVGRGIDWAFNKAWNGVKWVDRQTGISNGVANAARWANDKTGFTQGVSNLWNRSGAAAQWNRLTASDPNGQKGALARAWDWTSRNANTLYHGARNGYANAGQSVGLSRAEMYKGFDNGVKTMATAAQFVPIGRVAGVGMRALRGSRVAQSSIAGAERAAVEATAMQYAKTQGSSIAAGQFRTNAFNDYRSRGQNTNAQNFYGRLQSYANQAAQIGQKAASWTSNQVMRGAQAYTDQMKRMTQYRRPQQAPRQSQRQAPRQSYGRQSSGGQSNRRQ